MCRYCLKYKDDHDINLGFKVHETQEILNKAIKNHEKAILEFIRIIDESQQIKSEIKAYHKNILRARKLINNLYSRFLMGTN